MKKRGLASLFIVSIIAIAAVVGVVFAFQNAGRQKDVYGSISVVVDNDDIKLEVEVEKDESKDNGFRIVETPYSSQYVTITVGGLPASADRSVEWNESSISNGIVSIERVTPLEESGKTGINKFKITGQNGGAPVNVIFTTASGGQNVAVKVTVNMVAKFMTIGSSSHFGVRQGGSVVDLTSVEFLSKYVFYAHPDDVKERLFTPNKFPVEYRLKHDYQGVFLNDGKLSVTNDAVCVDQYIDLQVKLPAMNEWLDVPFYVFPVANKVITMTDAHKSETTADYSNVWDLIANRTEQSSATFSFALDNQPVVSGYGVHVESADSKIVRVDYLNQYERSISTVQNLGEVAVYITAYPIVKDAVTGKEIEYDDKSDVDVQIVDTVYLRVRNEFYLDSERSIYGDESFNIASNKKTLNVFSYEGNVGSYYDVFSLDTGNGKIVNMDANIEFELIVKDGTGKYTGTYRQDGQGNSNNWNIFSILDIGYWSSATNNWVMLTKDNYYANYLNQFSIAFKRSGNAENFLSPEITSLFLRVKSVNELSIGGYASCDIKLDPTSAIDKFEVSNLVKFDDGTTGVALVYDAKTQLFSKSSIDVYGMVAKDDGYVYSQRWNTAKVLDNSADLPFVIECNRNVPFTNDSGSFYHMTYDFTANDIAAIEYYKDYPMIIKYANGKSYTINIRVYPTVESLSMSVVSNSKGKIYQTITNNYNSSYEYVRTVYVRKGYDYQFVVNTPSVNVGACAVFEQIKDVNGHTISTDSNAFDATELVEGLYVCDVSLHAYSEKVFQVKDNERSFVVYIIVVDPVGNATLPTNLTFAGVDDSQEVTISMTNLNGESIVNNEYLHVDIAQENENVLIEQSGTVNKFKITAKYLTDESFKVGFKIYKQYDFTNFDLDGDLGLSNESPYDFSYIAGYPVETTISISQEKANQITVNGDNVYRDAKIGNYVKLISKSGEVVETEINVETSENARNKKLGLGYAEWKNGRYELIPVKGNEWSNEVAISNVAVASMNSANAGNLTIRPVSGVKSLGAYALVIYALDSLHYLKTENGVEYAVPETYETIKLLIGSVEEINTEVAELSNGIVHDANTGKRNDRGGFNWIVPDKTNNQIVATLLFTDINNPYGSKIEANTYYFDDLYTVLGWDILEEILRPTLPNPPSIYVHKFVITDGNAPVEIGSSSGVRLDKTSRLVLNLNAKFSDSDDDEEMYSHDNVVVYFQFTYNGSTLTFFVAQYIDNFDVKIKSENSSGLVARKNLAPEEYTNPIDYVTMQRGNGFDFSSNLNPFSGWNLNKTNFDPIEEGKTSNITYEGGLYTFYPEIQFVKNGITYTFELDALTAKVKVDIKGGVNYLNIVQDSVLLDGVSNAIYDLTTRVDQSNWAPNILSYYFLYDGIYYELFKDNTTVSYVNLEGGKAKLEFKLKCLNANTTDINFYYTYYSRIEVAVVIVAPDVDPFYDISGARLIVRENLTDSALAKVKTPSEDSASFSLVKQGIYNVTMAHFADTTYAENNKSGLVLTTGQTDMGVIYLDKDSAGGLLVIHPTPYYINVSNVSLSTAVDGYHTETVQIGTDLTGKPIYDTVTYSIGFTQMIYNETDKCYQPYIGNSETPKMVSSWSAAEGYKWTGKYYFKTSLVSNSQVAYRIPNGTRFKIQISIQGESNAKAITETMYLDAKYRDGFVVTPSDDVKDYAIRTMLQTQYQAVGTTAVYDVALPNNCVPNYGAFTLNGIGSSSTTITSTYVDVTINPVTKSLFVYLKADAKSIGQNIEIRIPYNRPGDYVNPYLSIVIVPVYFEFKGLEVIGHYETNLQLSSRDELTQLQYRALFNYDNSMAGNNLSEKMTTFNKSLLTTKLLSCNYETAGQIAVQVPYTYVNGVPVITKNADSRYAQTFTYEITNQNNALVKRTEYLAVGTAGTYLFQNWNALHVSKLYIQEGNNPAEIEDFWSVNKTVSGNNVSITVSLENHSNTVSNNLAYKKLIETGKIVLNVYSTLDSSNPQLELTIIPVYFTFDGFKLQNNPVKPLVALTTPTVVTVEASGVSAVNDSDVTSAINTFNAELLEAQRNLAANTTLFFNRIPNDNGIMNFNFDVVTREITRADSSNPITATSYLLVSAGIVYVNGVPTLNRLGNQISSYLSVRTFGANSESDSGNINVDFEPAPNGRVRTVAQAIGTKVRYNVALPGVIYDSMLDKYEVRADNNYVWQKSFGWNAVLNIKENTITVTLDANTNLFDKVLSIIAYNQDGELIYVLNIVPAYFTVEQLLLAEHIDEKPVMIKSGDVDWLEKLRLDFVNSHSDSFALSDFDFETEISKFVESLNNTSLVSRIDDAGYITLVAGINYEGGIPTLTNLVNNDTTVQNIYHYEMYDGVAENTKAQALGQEVVYNVNRKFESIKISTGVVDANGKENWTTFTSIMGEGIWSVERYTNNQTAIKVVLAPSADLIGKRIRIGVFVNDSDIEPAYILNVIPAYFTVEDITVKGQNSTDRNIFMYYGKNPDSPMELVFDPIIGNYSLNATLNNSQKINTFVQKFHSNEGSALIGRYYDSTLKAGDLHVSVYLDYQSGIPTLVARDSKNGYVTHLDVDFWYSIYGAKNEQVLPSMPNEVRSRTEVQAVGTTMTYQIDIDQSLSMDMDVLTSSQVLLEKRGWKALFENNVFSLELLSTDDAVEKLLENKDLVFNFYSGSKAVYTLTIQPVLFKINGVETVYPEQPANLYGLTATNAVYRAVAEYNDQILYKNDGVIQYIERFNTALNSSKNSLFEIEEITNVGHKYLKLDIAVDYGVAGSEYRKTPQLVDVNNNPLKVLESFVEYTYESAKSTTALHYQAVDTTAWYYLGTDYEGANVSAVVDGVVNSDVPNYVDAEIVPYNGHAVTLKVTLKSKVNLVDKLITISIDKGVTTFTMKIQPVWFVVEGFEVVNHPERRLWLISSDSHEEKVSDLLYRVRAHYAQNSILSEKIQSQLDAFNASLASFNNISGQWKAGNWADRLEISTFGSQYLVVRAGIDYNSHGVASIVENIDVVEPNKIVRDVFEYARYSDKVTPSFITYPNVSRSRSVTLTIGYEADYTLDIPGLGLLSDDLLALYQNTNSNFTNDNRQLQSYVNGSDGWTVSTNGNNLHVKLDANAQLATRELKVFIYFSKTHVNDTPDNYNKDNVAFVLTITPVLYKVTGFAITGYNDDEIHVSDINEFTNNLTNIDSANKFVPVYEYDATLLNEIVDSENQYTLKKVIENFSDEFLTSQNVFKTRTRGDDEHTYNFQITTSVVYQAYKGTALLANDTENRISQAFKVVVDADSNNNSREEYQAINTEKTYYLDDSALTNDMDDFTINGSNYTASWNKNNPHYVTVKLLHNASVGTPVDIQISSNLTLHINPVYYEVLGFEPVEHPERPVWIIEPNTVKDLKYRVITTDLSYLSGDLLLTVKNHIADLNNNLNNGEADKEIHYVDNEFITIDVAVEYNNGYPEIAHISRDKRNVVESIIKYRTWTSSLKPDTTHPALVGKAQFNQVIGKTKSYSLKNINGQIYYQYLWAENAGSLITPFENSSDGRTQNYEGLSINVDTVSMSLNVQLLADSELLKNKIRFFIPYLTTINGKEVWYSYCVEITPILFELQGLTITGTAENGYTYTSTNEIGLYVFENNQNYLLLTNKSESNTAIKYVVRINASNDSKLQSAIADAKTQIEANIANYILISNPSNNIGFDGTQLKRNCAKDYQSNNIIGLATYVAYENGLPKLVTNSKNLVSSEVLISTGYAIDDWKDKITSGEIIGSQLLANGVEYSIQAIGTAAIYNIEIPNAENIFYEDIKVVEKGTSHAVKIAGEQENLVTLVTRNWSNHNIEIDLSLASVVALKNYTIEIQIPYATDALATTAEYVYKCYITPVVFTVEGFYLKTAENNNLTIASNNVSLELGVVAKYSDDVSVRNTVKLMIQKLENSVNNAIRSGALQVNIVNVQGGINIRCLQSYGDLLIQRINNANAINKIESTIIIGYDSNGAVLGGVNALTDAQIDVQIQVTTIKGNVVPNSDKNQQDNNSDQNDNEDNNDSENNDNNDKDSDEQNNTDEVDELIDNLINNNILQEGHRTQYFQAVGTSRGYNLENNNLNITYYYNQIKILNAGAECGTRMYETFAYEAINSKDRGLVIKVTLSATVTNLSDYIEIRIPYSSFVEGELNWYYYSLQIKPVMFEVSELKLKVNNELIDTLTLNDSSYELRFSPDIISAPLNLTYFKSEELEYITNSIGKLETELNTYDDVNDKYKYLVINNTAQEGDKVNYSVYRDSYTNATYIAREINNASTTIMQVSANIVYGVSNFDSQNFDDVHIAIPGDSLINTQRITSQISVYTTDRVSQSINYTGISEYITQDNAHTLMSLKSGVNYILMSDIHLDKIPNLSQGRWKPVAFPVNTTLDGNNYKIFLNSTGFDLTGRPNDIGIFTVIPAGSVVKNLQVVLESGVSNNTVTTMEVNLSGYGISTINIGLLAGANEGIVTNCAVLSEWQFKMRDLLNIDNPVTGGKFTTSLPFNKDGYLFDDQYFYKLDLNNKNEIIVSKVYNEFGYLISKNDSTNIWEPVLDNYLQYKESIEIDRTNVAKYDDYSPIIYNQDSPIYSNSPARLYVYANNKNLTLVLGGLIGFNNKMITNSRVLIDVEVYGPEHLTDTGDMDENNILGSVVGGLVGLNDGTITSSYFRDASVINNSNAGVEGDSLLGGFVGQNNGIIKQSYAMGCSTNRKDTLNHISRAGAVKTIRNSLGGFVHINNGIITDCLVNMVIWKTGTEGAAGGFVYENTKNGVISNCVENNNIILQSSSTLDFYAPFVFQNGDEANVVNTKNLSNLIYAGNAESISLSDDWKGTLKHLSDNLSITYSDVKNYKGFSIGGKDSEVSAKNTIWQMTEVGPILRSANDIAVSFRKNTTYYSGYLYNPGTEKNPYLVWNEKQFNDYIYSATAYATEGDRNEGKITSIEHNRQGNHIRLVDDISTTGIKDTYKIIYTGTLEGNGLTMSGLGLDTVTNEIATFGLFGKTEYATIRNISFKINKINSTAKYVGGIAGIAINTNFVDVSVLSDGVIKGANIVGGFVGLNVITQDYVENYNLFSSVSATANFQNQQTDTGAELFGSGIEYYQQTLYASVKGLEQSYEQGYGVAGGLFGFVTSNPNTYRTVNEKGESEYHLREFKKIIIQTSGGKIIAQEEHSSKNTEADWFLKDAFGKVISSSIYNDGRFSLRHVTGELKDISGNVAGGLIGIMDETIELHNPTVTALSSLTGKYYLGGMIGINLGKISGELTDTLNNDGKNYIACNAMSLGRWTVLSSAGSSYIFRVTDNNSYYSRYWGMTVGAVAGYNDGFYLNSNSGVIENINVNVNVLSGSSSVYQYVIGGIVGVNGKYGSVTNSVNTNSTLNAITNRIQSQISKENAQRVGYYYGHIVGRGAQIDTKFSNLNIKNNQQSTRLIQIEFPTNYATNSYVSAKNFSTPNNTFGVTENETLKIQTMTMDEYYAYLSTTITNKDLPTRIELLQPWIRSLTTTISQTNLNGRTVWAEIYDYNEKQELLKWLKDNKIFEKWDNAHSSLSNKVFANFESYLNYSAVSDYTVNEESQISFENKINDYRDKRYKMALEFFKYQYQVTTQKDGTTINGVQNADFTWSQYEKYLLFKQNAKKNKISKQDNERNLTNLGQELADLLNPQNLHAEYKNNQEVIINSNEIFVSMIQNMTELRMFTNKDPLQIYLNYVVYTNKNNEINPFRIGDYEVKLAQYFYYMNNLYGTTVSDGKYSIPTNFTAIDANVVKDEEENKVPDYVSYVETNSLLKNSSTMLTVGEFIDMTINLKPKVIQNEQNWLLYGHRDGGARISTIGALDLKWVTNPSEWNETAKSKVKEQNGSLVYGDDNEIKWEAFAKYQEAYRKLGLTITKYTEMIKLGGTLYELTGSYAATNNAGTQTADNYIFALRCEQYNWTDEQIAFIKANYANDGNNLRYALTATTEGKIFEYADKGNIRAVYKTAVQVIDEGNNLWYSDLNGNSVYDEGEPAGVYMLSGSHGTLFKNGDNKEYFIYNAGNNSSRTINLSRNGNQGAAMYIDADKNKMFGTTIHASGGSSDTHEAGKDILVVYEVAESEEPDFFTKDENGNPDKYYKIVRQIVENDNLTITDEINESTSNRSDYLEEALWWRNQGFTVEEFDKIKAHAITRTIEAGFVNKNSNYQTRAVGYTLADDWTATVDSKKSGFKGGDKDENREKFTTAEYTEIVMGANYTTDGIWYSTYADYLLFTALYYSDQVDSIDSNSITALLPSTSQFNNPFFDPKNPYESPERNSIQFLENVTTENDLADAIEFTSTRVAFLTLFRAESNTAEYIGWAEENSYNLYVTDDKGNTKKIVRYFRLNHYIYWVQEKIDEKEKIEGGKFNAEDFRWCLTQSVRGDIFYEGVTQESRTTDLVEYRLNWYNSGNPFITFRDYCEWINIYAYSTEYRTARGDYEDVETGETLTSTDGWLTIEAYAVWKRMEKYENNVEYLAKIGTTAGQNVITAPILKRKISTTVFPKIFSSGEKQIDSNTSMASDEYTLLNPNPIDKNYSDAYYGWKDFNDSRFPTQYRSVIDRFEYNERYNIRKVTRNISSSDGKESILDFANVLINDNKFANTSHAVTDWNNRYGVLNNPYQLKLDETSLTDGRADADEYVQLYVPYAYFEKACKMIKSVYSASNGYAGYHNYMKYWARNGDYNWICDYSEYPGHKTDTLSVKYTYLATNFWNNYDGSKSPLGTDDVNGRGGSTAYGWKEDENK